MSDLEAALAAHLEGKFFWDPAKGTEHDDESAASLEIQRVQRKFYKDAQQITGRNKCLLEMPEPKEAIRNAVFTGKRKLVEPIVNAVGQVYGVPPKILLSRSTSHKYKKAKQHLHWAMFRYIPSMSYPWAGDLLGKNHSTIMHGRKMFEAEQDFEKVVEVDRLMRWKA